MRASTARRTRGSSESPSRRAADQVRAQREHRWHPADRADDERHRHRRQLFQEGARDVAGRRAEHEPGGQLRVPAPERLRDHAAHRVAGHDHRAGVQRLGHGGDVVRAVFQPVGHPGRRSAAVAPQVEGQHAEVLRESGDRTRPVGGRVEGDAVQQDEGRRLGRAGGLPYDEAAASGRLDDPGFGPRFRVRHSHADPRWSQTPVPLTRRKPWYHGNATFTHRVTPQHVRHVPGRIPAGPQTQLCTGDESDVSQEGLAPPLREGPSGSGGSARNLARHAIRGDAMIDEGDRRGRGPGRAARDHQTRLRLAARHAEHLYPGPLGRLVAHELTAYAERHPGLHPGGLAESVVREVLDRPAPRGRRPTRVRSGEISSRGGARR